MVMVMVKMMMTMQGLVISVILVRTAIAVTLLRWTQR
jgi:hypothetical protein